MYVYKGIGIWRKANVWPSAGEEMDSQVYECVWVGKILFAEVDVIVLTVFIIMIYLKLN